MMKRNMACAALMLLGACGGTTTVIQPVAAPQAVIAGDDLFAFNAADRTITLTTTVGNIGSGIDYTGAAFSNAAGKIFRQTTPLQRLVPPGQPRPPATFTVYAIANQPGVTAISAVTHQAEEVESGLILAREAVPQSLPSITTATFQGPYQAMLSRNSDGRNYVSELIEGDFSVTANLNTGRVTGQIANRRPLPNDISPDPVPPSAIRNITFDLPIVLESASFSGPVSGGELVPDSFVGREVVTQGQTTGIFGGADGATLAGHIVMRHADGAYGPAVERGVYAATRFPTANPFDPPQSQIILRPDVD